MVNEPATIHAISYKKGAGVWGIPPRSLIQLVKIEYPSGSKYAAIMIPTIIKGI
jgi:hypothetical protein